MPSTRTILLGQLLTVALLASSCGMQADSSPSEALRSHQIPVVGGSPALPSEYPSTAALVDSLFGQPFCTGTLIAPNAVVTAAHCLEGWLPISATRVVLGYANPASAPPSARLPISKRFVHPQYDSEPQVDSDGLGLSNDIGVVILTNPIANAPVTPILPKSVYDAELPDWTPASHRDVDVVGFGIYNLNGDKTGLLYKGRTPHIRHIATEMLAGRPGEPDSCNGDSGGPVYLVRDCTLWLVGVTSRAWAGSTAQCGDGGIYTIPSAYISWIESVIGAPLPAADLDGGGLASGVCLDDGGLAESSAPDATALDAPKEAALPESGKDAPDAWDAHTEVGEAESGSAGKGGNAGAGGSGGFAGQGGSAGQAQGGSSGTGGSGGTAASPKDAGNDAPREAGTIPATPEDGATLEGGACACAIPALSGSKAAPMLLALVGLSALSRRKRRR